MKQVQHPPQYPNIPDSYVGRLSANGKALAEEIKIGKIAEFLFDKIIEENGKAAVSCLGDNNLGLDPISPHLVLTLDESIGEHIRSYENITLDDLEKASSLIIRSIGLSFASDRNNERFYSALGVDILFSDDLKKYQVHVFFPNHYDGEKIMTDMRKNRDSIKTEILGGKLALGKGSYGRA